MGAGKRPLGCETACALIAPRGLRLSARLLVQVFGQGGAGLLGHDGEVTVCGMVDPKQNAGARLPELCRLGW